jgi:hypothetical protein
MVLKVAQAPEETDYALTSGAFSPAHRNYWKREFVVYQSGALDGLLTGVAAPRCYDATEELGRGRVWLWLEALADRYDRHWGSAQYGAIAYQFGLFNGAYLAGRPIPEYPWLSQDVLRDWTEAWRVGAEERLAETQSDPLVRRGFSAATVERLLRLLDHSAQFYAGLDRLPKTLAHLDTVQANLFVRRGADGRDQAVAIDWANLGREAVGVEMNSLVGMSAFENGEVANLHDLSALVFRRYLDGLTAAGWQADEPLVRFGYTAGVALCAGSVLSRYCLAPQLDNASATAQSLFHCSLEELMDRVAAVLSYTLDLADEARALLPSVMR